MPRKQSRNGYDAEATSSAPKGRESESKAPVPAGRLLSGLAQESVSFRSNQDLLMRAQRRAHASRSADVRTSSPQRSVWLRVVDAEPHGACSPTLTTTELRLPQPHPVERERDVLDDLVLALATWTRER